MNKSKQSIKLRFLKSFLFLVIPLIFTSVVLSAILGDADGDGDVDIFDYSRVITDLNKTNSSADLDANGIVDMADYEIVVDNFGLTNIAPTSLPSPMPSNPSTTGGVLISKQEIMPLPTSGPAWDTIKNKALSSWGTPDLMNQDLKHDLAVMSGALYYARTDDVTMRTKTKNAIMSIIGTERVGANNAILSLGRQLGGYVVAADLIDLKNFSPSDDQTFRNWLSNIRTRNLGGHGRWYVLASTHENSANNWGTFAGASRIAASIYLNDTVDVARSANILRSFLGERSYYPANAPGTNGYFQPTAGWERSETWSCNPATWIAVNPACVKSGYNLDGAIVEDVSRGGGFPLWPPGADGIMYSWEVLQGIYFQAELLHRQGYDTYNWSNKALKRAVDFMDRTGWGITSPSKYVPWMANYRYNTNYPTLPNTGTSGRVMSYGDWLFDR